VIIPSTGDAACGSSQECTILKFTTVTTVLTSAATAGAIGVIGAPIAAAEDTTNTLGNQ
jgi:hypothetical protein